MQLYEEAGIPATSFLGTPVFQAAGLSIRTDQARSCLMTMPRCTCPRQAEPQQGAGQLLTAVPQQE